MRRRVEFFVVEIGNRVSTGSGSDRVSLRSGRCIDKRVTIAQRFIAGNANVLSAKSAPRTTELSRPFYELAIHWAESIPPMNRSVILIRPLRGMITGRARFPASV